MLYRDLIRAPNIRASIGAVLLALLYAPVVTLMAGERFLGLVPTLQQELCGIELQYYVNAVADIQSVRIVNVVGQNFLNCGT